MSAQAPGRTHPYPAAVDASPELPAAGAVAADAGDHGGRPVDHGCRLDHVLAETELLEVEPQRDPDQLREVQDRHAERAPDDLLGTGLLEVEVEVAQRAGRDQAVGVGVDRVAEVAAGLLERRLPV